MNGQERVEATRLEKATVTCAMDYFALGIPVPESVEGYACEVLEVPLVVHHMLRYDGGPHPRLWVVTEPITGRTVTAGASSTRAKAIENAERTIFKAGGPDVLTREVENFGPLRQPTPNPKES
jgi:hypothetical protein